MLLRVPGERPAFKVGRSCLQTFADGDVRLPLALEELLEALQLRGGDDATSLPSPCSTTDDILLPNPGDEYFVAMCRLPKGRRLLRRAIPLLVPEFSQPVFSTVFRNIGVLQCTDDSTRTAEDDDLFMTMAHSLVDLNVDADPNTHSVLMHAM